MNIYYVYFYIRSDFTPYYVGKGKDKRAWTKGKKELIQVPRDKSKIILVEQNLTELQAVILERYYIRWFGRKDIGTGILRNKTDGGDGISPEDASREQMRKVKNGTHHLLKRPDGSSWGKTVNEISIQNGTNSLLKRPDGSSIGKEINDLRVKNGTHHFFNNKYSVSCRNNTGECKRISRELYHSQTGPKEDWEWVCISSKEGKRRKIYSSAL